MPGSPSRQPSPSRIGRATRTAITRFLDLFPHSTRREPTIARGRDAGHSHPPSTSPLADTPSGPVRVALYSHDTVGLGHMRRNLLIARTLASSDFQPVILMIAGGREAGLFSVPPGVGCLNPPAPLDVAGGHYRSM